MVDPPETSGIINGLEQSASRVRTLLTTGCKEPMAERMRRLFDGDGSEVREQFILAGLLLTIFERFKAYVVGHVDGFFAEQIEIKNGRLHPIRGAKFKQLVKDKGAHEPGQHANKDFRAALHWFLDLNAITTDEFNEVERLYSLRNEIGHELLEIIADDSRAPIGLYDILLTFAVYVKIVRWWIKEVEATTDPDFDEERYEEMDWDAVESVDTIILRQIIHKSLEGNAQWDAAKRMVREPFDSSAEAP